MFGIFLNICRKHLELLPVLTAYLPLVSRAILTFLVLLELLSGAFTCLSRAWKMVIPATHHGRQTTVSAMALFLTTPTETKYQWVWSENNVNSLASFPG